ncbi:MAG: MBL fold metallo-hydrolase [Bacteroidaceae bacterium]|jgi:glyoxylase-like metal-dependent hydrolase (beta-lactamase superfamily II)
MLHIQKFVVNMIQENCYILNDETNEAVIIDDGAYYPEEKKAIEQYILNNNLKPVHLLDTHAHFDHIMGNEDLFQKFDLKAEFHENDAYLYDTISLQIQSLLSNKLNVHKVPAGPFIKSNDLISFGNIQLRVIETPGHTPGGVCFYCESEKVLFSGDSLFKQSIGRTDLPGGDGVKLLESLKRNILTLPDETKVFPGHGPSTTIKDEKERNIYFK